MKIKCQIFQRGLLTIHKHKEAAHWNTVSSKTWLNGHKRFQFFSSWPCVFLPANECVSCAPWQGQRIPWACNEARLRNFPNNSTTTRTNRPKTRQKCTTSREQVIQKNEQIKWKKVKFCCQAEPKNNATANLRVAPIHNNRQSNVLLLAWSARFLCCKAGLLTQTSFAYQIVGIKSFQKTYACLCKGWCVTFLPTFEVVCVFGGGGGGGFAVFIFWGLFWGKKTECESLESSDEIEIFGGSPELCNEPHSIKVAFHFHDTNEVTKVGYFHSCVQMVVSCFAFHSSRTPNSVLKGKLASRKRCLVRRGANLFSVFGSCCISIWRTKSRPTRKICQVSLVIGNYWLSIDFAGVFLQIWFCGSIVETKDLAMCNTKDSMRVDKYCKRGGLLIFVCIWGFGKKHDKQYLAFLALTWRWQVKSCGLKRLLGLGEVLQFAAGSTKVTRLSRPTLQAPMKPLSQTFLTGSPLFLRGFLQLLQWLRQRAGEAVQVTGDCVKIISFSIVSPGNFKTVACHGITLSMEDLVNSLAFSSLLPRAVNDRHLCFLMDILFWLFGTTKSTLLLPFQCFSFRRLLLEPSSRGIHYNRITFSYSAINLQNNEEGPTCATAGRKAICVHLQEIRREAKETTAVRASERKGSRNRRVSSSFSLSRQNRNGDVGTTNPISLHQNFPAVPNICRQSYAINYWCFVKLIVAFLYLIEKNLSDVLCQPFCTVWQPVNPSASHTGSVTLSCKQLVLEKDRVFHETWLKPNFGS